MGEETREGARSPLRSHLAEGMSLATRSSFARQLLCSPARVRTLGSAPRRDVLLFLSVCLSSRRSPLSSLLFSLSFCNSRVTEHPRSLAFLFSSFFRRERQGTSSLLRQRRLPATRVPPRFARDSLVLPPLPPLTPLRRKRLVCYERQLDRVDRPRFGSLPFPLLLPVPRTVARPVIVKNEKFSFAVSIR